MALRKVILPLRRTISLTELFLPKYFATKPALAAEIQQPDRIVDSVSQIREKAIEEYEREGIRPLYLDVQATSPIDPRVLDSMLPYMVAQYGNPHSRSHAYGWESEAAMEKARKVSRK